MKTVELFAQKAQREVEWPVNRGLLSSQWLAVPLLLATDALAILVSMLVAFAGRRLILPGLFPGLFQGQLLTESLENLWWLPAVAIAVLAYEELYRKRLPFWLELERILRASTLAAFLSVAFLYVTKTGNVISRTLVVATWLALLLLLPLFRYAIKRLLVRTGVWEKPVLVLGAGRTAELLVKAFRRERTLGYSILGVLDDNEDIEGLRLGQDSDPAAGLSAPRLGSFADAPGVIRRTGVSDLILAAPGLKPERLVEWVNRLQPLVNNIMVVPDLFGLSLNGIEAEYFLDEQLLLLNIRNRLKSALNRGVKRAFDLLLGLLSLLVALPVGMLIALAIRIDSRGSAFFVQTRLGQDGRQFSCLKFRTMYRDSDSILKTHLKRSPQARREWEKFNKLKGEDPRVTRVGAVLRRYSLDELPQILNVLVGDMSLVGPRPYLPREEGKIGSALYDIQVTKPGLSGLWQVSGRNNIDFAGRVKLDVWYVRNWSLWLDIVLLLRTVGVVWKRDGAY
ncbi:undecaprenyl-phosphate galactose phosphotransferase WbaP [Acididesulfobacillus acetoxydans]|uniref:Undecaprenyl-phosphate galactose phosphotransferase n=1 Tax=Acididesulfobacillus acetoxydans TaxID=1561005 RepID=A0A8S0XUM6_9FIRM|nr:undecaprenyl-phosphate galactose phosphotransferase WbaP [Acididesulfobacillus acetoxydans]CAA7599587.1 undecaprenyl-phosphate galactose phosphotransferase WbaP [Acididesulfobacillus acetoxydans]CEJ07782.1 Undecaprenyl-phosphate galactose phosphotransferase [Acididesulfobacillus acetoxydans]